MPRRFHTLDVFTDTKTAGNPLAVVHDGDGLDTVGMQAIAREFNLSETVFVLPPVDPINTAKIRIFTPTSELPFAGHPTVGTGVLLALLRAPELVRGSGVVIALEEGIGLVKVEVTRPQGRATRGVFALPRLPTLPEAPPRDAALAAKALGLVPMTSASTAIQSPTPPPAFPTRWCRSAAWMRWRGRGRCRRLSSKRPSAARRTPAPIFTPVTACGAGGRACSRRLSA